MKIRPFYILILCIALNGQLFSQDPGTAVLLTVAGDKTEAGEFIRMYRKSNEPDNKMTVDEYLPQFILFKLKVADAMAKGYDTTASFRNELNGYRTQLAQNYLTDSQAKEKLLKKAYDRYTKEVNAWHILIAVPQNAAPADTLKAWKKAMEVRERILRGEAFEQVARASSDDKSVNINGGNLGYFTAFQMVIQFEDAAYTLKKGTLSKPVRSPFGYHIIRVTDIRPSRGRIHVAHIMKSAPPGTSEENIKKAGEDLNTVYNELKQGAAFDVLARKYSDHKESAAKGGVLNWFGTGEMIPEFSEAAFALTDTGTYTRPFRTIYGWHIVKLLGRQATGTFEETRSFLESRINQSYLAALTRKTFSDRLKKEYRFRINTNSLEWFVKNTDSTITKGTGTYNQAAIPDGIIFSFADRTETNIAFASFIEKRILQVPAADSASLIRSLLDACAYEQLLAYENSQLERKYPDFRYLMKEFHDGILLFDISNREVWDRVSHDSTGMRRYYEQHRHDYLTEREADAIIYMLKDPEGSGKLQAAFTKYKDKQDPGLLLKSKFNRKNDTLLTMTETTWKEGEAGIPAGLTLTAGAHQCKINGNPAIVNILRVRDPEPRPLEEVRDKMMTGFQEYLEKEWTKQLNEKYSVKIDSFVLGEVKKNLINE